MHQPGVELAIIRSQVRRPNHYTTQLPIIMSLLLYILLIAVLLASENDQRPYDPFGDDDDMDVTTSVPIVLISRTLTTATETLATVCTVL